MKSLTTAESYIAYFYELEVMSYCCAKWKAASYPNKQT